MGLISNPTHSLIYAGGSPLCWGGGVPLISYDAQRPRIGVIHLPTLFWAVHLPGTPEPEPNSPATGRRRCRFLPFSSKTLALPSGSRNLPRAQTPLAETNMVHIQRHLLPSSLECLPRTYLSGAVVHPSSSIASLSPLCRIGYNSPTNPLLNTLHHSRPTPAVNQRR